MRGALEGTKHTTILDRRESAILEAVRNSLGVTKVEPTWIVRTGPVRRRLQLRWMENIRGIEGWLYIGSGKRRCLIFVERETALSNLRDSLEACLRRFGIPVETMAAQAAEQFDNTGDQLFMDIANNDNHSNHFVAEQKWAWCEHIYEVVKTYKGLEDKEMLLELELEEVRSQKNNARSDALETLTKIS